ncbi:hypothetical protein K5549_015492 [Capra hircus]|uniref:Uncharacterized protein n=1 Tax=Capra hircus TaxID=9925 RepID=A0A452EVF6_CAPHI|nr:hypothetical protein K5549_015492 [Capra hircus]
MASISELTSISSLVLRQQEVLPHPSLLPQLRRKEKQRKKNLKNLMVTWALVFLTKPL